MKAPRPIRSAVAIAGAVALAFQLALPPALNVRATEVAPEPQAAPRTGAVIESADVIVYGGTPAGIVAAVAADRRGADVALVEPSARIGGMMSNGLSWTDRGDAGVIGGLAREVFNRIQALEGSVYGRYAFQPSTADAAFAALLVGSDVRLHVGERLLGSGAVLKNGARIISFTTESGSVFSAKQFIDATYEGDLMAQAGVTYRVGREATSQFGESLAGVRPSRVVMTVPAGMDPGFPLAAPGAVGTGDARIQASNFRICLSSNPSNQAPFPQPEGYDPARFDILVEHFAQRIAAGQTPALSWVLRLDRLTNDKWDVNESGQISLGVPGANYAYPDASYADREQLYHFHRKHNQGLLFFLATDERVPPTIQDDINRFGLCADEFTDNANWPRQLYLREGRRMVGRYVVAQVDQNELRSKNDIIGLASYPVDSHTVSRWINSQGRLLTEGGFFASATRRWAIPYRSLTPAAAEATNLLVPVTASATHVGYASLRMEPQYMIMGEAAGIASAMAAASGAAVQSVPIASLQNALRAARAILTDPGDIGTSIFYGDIVWAYRAGIILNCGPGQFCPTGIVSRADMADFISRARHLPPATRDYFTDDEGHPSEDNINRMAEARITVGCTATRFCPSVPVTRAQMASFLKRAYSLPPAARDYFTDDETSVHEGDINRLAQSGITRGCTATTFCPNRTIVRGEMMAFLRRASAL